jgi:hypothetical protein
MVSVRGLQIVPGGRWFDFCGWVLGAAVCSQVDCRYSLLLDVPFPGGLMALCVSGTPSTTGISPPTISGPFRDLLTSQREKLFLRWISRRR